MHCLKEIRSSSGIQGNRICSCPINESSVSFEQNKNTNNLIPYQRNTDKCIIRVHCHKQ